MLFFTACHAKQHFVQAGGWKHDWYNHIENPLLPPPKRNQLSYFPI